jgi:tetratricopeptide (TPR) repeat protein
LDVITRLLEKSLIVAEPQEAAMRYRMLEIIRQYAMEKMEQRDEVQQVKDRTTHYFGELAQSAERAWYSQQQSRLIQQFGLEYPNLRAALAWGLNNPKRSSIWEQGVKLAFALAPCWNLLAQLNEGLGWLKKVRDQANGLLAESETGSTKRAELLSIKAKAMYEYAALSYYLTMHAAAIDLFEESARIYQELGDETGMAYPNLYIAQAAENQGQKYLARQIWIQSLEQFHRIGDLWYAAMVHSFLGWLERGLNDYDAAAREFYSAIDLYNQIGDEWGMSIMLSHLGVSAFQQGDPDKARDFFERRLAIARRNGFKHSIAYATLLIGITYWKLGDDLRLEDCLREAMHIFPQIGNYIGLVDCVVGMAWVAAKRNELERAAYLLGAAEKANETYGRKYFFEYDYFYQPIRDALIVRFAGKYGSFLEQGRHADFDEVVKNILQNRRPSSN